MAKISTAVSLQVLATVLFVVSHMNPVSGPQAYELGKHHGKRELQEALYDRGIEVPKDLKVRKDKDLFVNASIGWLQETFTLFAPALIMQIAAIVTLLLALRKSVKGELNKEVEPEGST